MLILLAYVRFWICPLCRCASGEWVAGIFLLSLATCVCAYVPMIHDAQCVALWHAIRTREINKLFDWHMHMMHSRPVWTCGHRGDHHRGHTSAFQEKKTKQKKTIMERFCWYRITVAYVWSHSLLAIYFSHSLVVPIPTQRSMKHTHST